MLVQEHTTSDMLLVLCFYSLLSATQKSLYVPCHFNTCDFCFVLGSRQCDFCFVLSSRQCLRCVEEHWATLVALHLSVRGINRRMEETTMYSFVMCTLRVMLLGRLREGVYGGRDVQFE
jgi:hypothetical protein